jgi:hypothetical protein
VSDRAAAREVIRRRDPERARRLDELDPLPLPCTCPGETEVIEVCSLSRLAPWLLCTACGRAQNAG